MHRFTTLLLAALLVSGCASSSKETRVRPVLLTDDYYGVSGFSFVRCIPVGLVGSTGSSTFSVVQPVCVSSTTSLY
jgi:hypothetical protein